MIFAFYLTNISRVVNLGSIFSAIKGVYNFLIIGLPR
jgi:hypothetical protein